jgi:hypothetical protein
VAGRIIVKRLKGGPYLVEHQPPRSGIPAAQTFSNFMRASAYALEAATEDSRDIFDASGRFSQETWANMLAAHQSYLIAERDAAAGARAGKHELSNLSVSTFTRLNG